MEIDIKLLETPKSWNTETDSQLWEAARSLNQEAWVAIFDRYAQPVYNYALCLCNDSLIADQVVGEVFAKFLDQVTASQRLDFSLRSRLFQVAYQIIVRLSHSPDPKSASNIAAGFRWMGRGWLISAEDQSLLEVLLRAIIMDLSEDQRHVIVLRFLEGFSLLEIANITGKKAYNVSMIQNRGIAKLRKILAKSF
jgi:RNA polymerase sigma-70 factor, ECF subfamily